MRVLYAKNGGALAVEAEKGASFDFLFQIAEKGRGEKCFNRDIQPVTELFDGCHGSAVVSSAYDVVHRGLGDTADGT